MRNLVTHRSPLGNVDRWFDALFQDLARPGSTNAPPVDIRQAAKGYVVEVELPGLGKKDFSVDVDQNLLTVASNAEQTAEPDGRGYVVRERRSGSFKRSFMLPQDIDADRISADFRDGLLTVHLPQAAKPKPKQIAVKGDS